MNAAAVQQAVAAAPTNLPDLPAYCSDAMPRVVPKVGEKWRWVQFRHEVVTDQENARIEWCANWYATRQAQARGIQSP